MSNYIKMDRIKEMLNLYEHPKEWSAFISGLLFSVGWWIIFDISAHYSSEVQFQIKSILVFYSI